MPDDDDDEIAIDDGQESADADEVSASDNDPRIAAGGPVTAVVPVRKGTRPISDKVREVFAASMAKIKAAGGGDDDDDEGGLEPVEHEEAPAEAAPSVAKKGEGETTALGTDAPAQATAAAPPQVAAPVVAPAPIAAAPPAPSLDPEVMRLRTDLEQQRQDFEAEKQRFMEASRTTDIAKLREVYFDKGAPAIVDVLKQWHPGLSDEDLKSEVADLIQDLAHQYLEAPLEDPIKERIASKRVRAGLKAWRAEQDRLEEERQKQILSSQEEENRLRVKKILHQEVTKPEHREQFPWLASEDNAGDLVYEVIDTEYRKSGTQLTWNEAAKRADDWLKQRSVAFYDKRKHLLSPTPQPQQSAPSEKQRAQGDTQVQQVTRAAQKPKPPAVPERPVQNGKWSAEAHRQQIKQKFRGQLKSAYAEDE